MLTSMACGPILGTPLRIPPGRLAIKLNAEHRRMYRAVYAHYGTVLHGLPVLREDRDFEGRTVKVTAAELDALNGAFASLTTPIGRPATRVFEAQEQSRRRLFKRLQYLS